jgi:hypothetical protein
MKLEQVVAASAGSVAAIAGLGVFGTVVYGLSSTWYEYAYRPSPTGAIGDLVSDSIALGLAGALFGSWALGGALIGWTYARQPRDEN